MGNVELEKQCSFRSSKCNPMSIIEHEIKDCHHMISKKKTNVFLQDNNTSTNQWKIETDDLASITGSLLPKIGTNGTLMTRE